MQFDIAPYKTPGVPGEFPADRRPIRANAGTARGRPRPWTAHRPWSESRTRGLVVDEDLPGRGQLVRPPAGQPRDDPDADGQPADGDVREDVVRPGGLGVERPHEREREDGDAAERHQQMPDRPEFRLVLRPERDDQREV